MKQQSPSACLLKTPLFFSLIVSCLLGSSVVVLWGVALRDPVMAQSKPINQKQVTQKEDPNKQKQSQPESSRLKQNIPQVKSNLPLSGPPQRERIEADVSTRSIAITSGYSGAEVLVFGAIENGRQPTAESGYYDVVVVVEGASNVLTLRKKSRVAGLWVNTHSFQFNAVPTFYALASTRPIEDFISASRREELGLGFNTVSMTASSPKEHLTSEELIDYKNAVVRLKQAQGLFSRNDRGVFFTGRGLFRSTIHLPATVPVGTLSARLYLFHDGVLLSTYTSEVMLKREGIESWIYAFAFERPFSYGILAVLIAMVTGLVASALFHRRTV